MKTQMINKNVNNTLVRAIAACFLFFSMVTVYSATLSAALGPIPYRSSTKEGEAEASLTKLKALCDELSWVSHACIKADSKLRNEIEEIKRFIGHKTGKNKVFSDKGVNFINLKDIADELAEREVVQLYDLVVECNFLVRKHNDDESQESCKDRVKEPTITEKISAVATQAKDKVVDIGQRIGKAFKSGSEEVSKKAKGAAEVVSKKAEEAKDTIKAKASSAREKVKETGEKIKETGEKCATGVKNKMHEARQKVGSYMEGARQKVDNAAKSVQKNGVLKDMEPLKNNLEDVLQELEEFEFKMNSHMRCIESLKSKLEETLEEVERLED